MKRKACKLTQEEKNAKNGRYVSFSKRRKGLFRKASEFCLMFDAEIAILVLSEAGRPYSFGHSSVDTVLSRYMRPEEQQPAEVVGSVTLEEQGNKFRGLKGRQKSSKRKRESGGDQELDWKVADVKDWIEEELKACKTVEEMAALKDKYLVLLQNVNKRLKTSSDVLDKGKEKQVPTEPAQTFEDWYNSMLTCEPRNHYLHTNNYAGEGSSWYQNLEDGNALGVSMEPIPQSKEICSTSTQNFEIDRHLVLGDHQGNSNGGEGSFFYKDLEDGKAQCVSNQPISKSEDIFSNSIINFYSEHHGNNNANGGDESFWDKYLEDDKAECLSIQPISTYDHQDILPNSTLNFEGGLYVADEHHANNNGGEGFPLEDGTAECLSKEPIWKYEYEDLLSNSTPNFQGDRRVVDEHHGNNNGSEGSFWDDHLRDGKAEFLSMEPVAKPEDILSNSTLSSESNHHHLVDDHLGNNTNGWEGSFPNENLEDGKAQDILTEPIVSQSAGILSDSTFNFESNHLHVVDDHVGNNINGGEGYSGDGDLEHGNNSIQPISKSNSSLSFEGSQHDAPVDHHGNDINTGEGCFWDINWGNTDQGCFSDINWENIDQGCFSDMNWEDDPSWGLTLNELVSVDDNNYDLAGVSPGDVDCCPPSSVDVDTFG